METRITEHGSTRYSFPLGKQDPRNVIRIFERDNKLSVHFVDKIYGEGGLKSRQQFVLAVKNNKLYMYLTTNRVGIRAITNDRLSQITINIAKDIFDQSAENKGMALGSIACIKKIIYRFLSTHITWYPQVSINKVKMYDIITLASSKIVADRYRYEGVISLSPGVIQNIMRHSSTLRDMSKKIFGFSSPWAMQQSIGVLNGRMPYALLFKGILPVDDIKKIYDTVHANPDQMSSMYWFMEIPKFRRFFKMFHKDTIINWYKPYPDIDHHSYYHSEAERWLGDTVRMWDSIPESIREIPRGMTNLKQIHDLLSITHSKVAQSDFELNVNKKAIEIDGDMVNGMELCIPKTNYELIEWGTYMSNCIASYSHSKNILIGVKHQGELKYCIEVNNGKLWQFLAKYNKEAPAYDRNTISQYLIRKDIVKEVECIPAY